MIKLNDIVRCEPNGNLMKPFIGQVEKIYERTVMVKVLGHHACDRWKVIELTGRVIVAQKKVSPAVIENRKNVETDYVNLLNEA